MFGSMHNKIKGLQKTYGIKLFGVDIKYMRRYRGFLKSELPQRPWFD